MQASILSACNTSPALIPPNQFEKILTFMPGLASAEETFRNWGNDMPPIQPASGTAGNNFHGSTHGFHQS